MLELGTPFGGLPREDQCLGNKNDDREGIAEIQQLPKMHQHHTTARKSAKCRPHTRGKTLNKLHARRWRKKQALFTTRSKVLKSLLPRRASNRLLYLRPTQARRAYDPAARYVFHRSWQWWVAHPYRFCKSSRAHLLAPPSVLLDCVVSRRVSFFSTRAAAALDTFPVLTGCFLSRLHRRNSGSTARRCQRLERKSDGVPGRACYCRPLRAITLGYMSMTLVMGLCVHGMRGKHLEEEMRWRILYFGPLITYILHTNVVQEVKHDIIEARPSKLCHVFDMMGMFLYFNAAGLEVIDTGHLGVKAAVWLLIDKANLGVVKSLRHPHRTTSFRVRIPEGLVYIEVFPTFVAAKCGNDKDDIATRIKCAIAATRSALNKLRPGPYFVVVGWERGSFAPLRPKEGEIVYKGRKIEGETWKTIYKGRGVNVRTSNGLRLSTHITKYGLSTCSHVTKLPACNQAVESDVTGVENLPRQPISRLVVPRNAARTSAPVSGRVPAIHDGTKQVESLYAGLLRESIPVVTPSNWCSPPRAASSQGTKSWYAFGEHATGWDSEAWKYRNMIPGVAGAETQGDHTEDVFTREVPLTGSEPSRAA
ncbi:hypothetical protein PR048_014704 [Dryococelus australis]|uniref:Ribosomal protein L32 n=1 Tax=Dryococelus australis TaxID=614101 RepID=A0ABQ9HEZ0_9NEOP|nr:hypothetical protein PR048_014704 [Dryococelus australis]